MDWINPELTSKEWIKTSSEAYSSADPFPHINIKNFLKKEKLDALVDALSEVEFEIKESDLFSLAQTKDLVENPNPVIAEFVNLLKSDEFRKWVNSLTGVETSKELDLFGAIYRDTDYLLCHDDQLEGRKLAFILYLSTVDSGALALFSDDNGPDEEVKSYPALENSIVIFTVSDKSWHEVEEVIGNVNRVSIGGWLH